MNKKLLFVIVALIQLTVKSQSYFSSVITISKTYSQNGKFYLKTIPFDDEHPSIRGKSFLYETKNDKLIYTVDRYFNYNGDSENFLAVSNDGNTIAQFLFWGASEEVTGLNSISIYKNGNLFKSYSLTEITGCDLNNEKCNLVYWNTDSVIDKVKSKWGTKEYKKTLKEGISEKEAFLNEYAIFSNNDTVYFTDSRKNVHLLDLKTASIISTNEFDSFYPLLIQLKNKNHVETQVKERPEPANKEFFPELLSGKQTGAALADELNMKAVHVYDNDFYKYINYGISLSAYIHKSGKIEIEKLEVDKALPYDQIRSFLERNIYDMHFLPPEIDKWHFRSFLCNFRNKSDSVAELETLRVKRERQIERERRLTVDSINGIYIPKNLEECFIQLDKILKKIDKKEMVELKNSFGMYKYHLGIGMWIRNNWGLWGGSRLEQYFKSNGVQHPDDMSGIILTHYYDWLHGVREYGKIFEVIKKK